MQVKTLLLQEEEWSTEQRVQRRKLQLNRPIAHCPDLGRVRKPDPEGQLWLGAMPAFQPDLRQQPCRNSHKGQDRAPSMETAVRSHRYACKNQCLHRVPDLAGELPLLPCSAIVSRPCMGAKLQVQSPSQPSWMGTAQSAPFILGHLEMKSRRSASPSRHTMHTECSSVLHT